MKKTAKRWSSALLAGVMALSLAILPAQAAGSNQLVTVDLWHAVSNQASMGNVATDNNGKALYNPTTNTLQVATNPVNVSGYQSAITKAQYDSTGSGDYVDVKVLSTDTVQTGTKNDGVDHTVTYLSSFEIDLPDYITGKGIEFIPLKMAVPYTPMDVVVGTGYLDARLRIDWSQVETTELTQIQPDTTMSSGQVQTVDRTDSASGLRLVTDSAKVASDTDFVVNTITSGSDYNLAKTALSGTADSFTLYQVKLSLSGNEVEPYGAITLVFPYTGASLYRINADGTKTVLRGSATDDGYEIMTTKIGLFAVVGGSKISANTSGTAFTDITGHWAQSYITRAVNEGLFNGTSATTFSPNNTMTSGMIMTVLYRMAGSPAVTLSGAVENVPAGAWYETASAWGYEKGIIGGYKTYEPTKAASRQELATMLYRFYTMTNTAAAAGDLSAFTDAGSVASWAKDALAWANAAGIVTGTTTTTLSPGNSATRAQVATMLCRYLDYAK